jgi:hypothetical protein
MTVNKCKCGLKATQLIIIKGNSLVLCERHVEKVEKLLGEKLEPLTKFTTAQLIKELIRRKLIEVSPREVNITSEFMNELRADFYYRRF